MMVELTREEVEYLSVCVAEDVRSDAEQLRRYDRHLPVLWKLQAALDDDN